MPPVPCGQPRPILHALRTATTMPRRRRIFAVSAVAATGMIALGLASCSKPAPPTPADILQKASIAMDSLQSMDFSAKGSVGDGSGSAASLRFTADGTVQFGGQQTKATVTVEGSVPQKGTAHSVSVDADVMSEWGQALFLYVRKADVRPPLPGMQLGLLSHETGSWMRVPLGAGNPGAVAVTPDPRLLRAQFAVLEVTHDDGAETIDGHAAYHYAVSIDRQKLLSFLRQSAEANGEDFDAATADAELSGWQGAGDVWIDAQNFYVRRFMWNIQVDRGATNPPAAVVLDVRVTDQNAAPPITFPTDTVLAPPNFLQAVLGSSMMPFASALESGNPSGAAHDDQSIVRQLYERQKALEQPASSSGSAASVSSS